MSQSPLLYLMLARYMEISVCTQCLRSDKDTVSCTVCASILRDRASLWHCLPSQVIRYDSW